MYFTAQDIPMQKHMSNLFLGHKGSRLQRNGLERSLLESQLPSKFRVAAHRHPDDINRRMLFVSSFALCIGVEVSTKMQVQATPLAPLGGVKSTGEKRVGLSLPELKSRLEVSLQDDKYFVTGNIDSSIFDDQCRFVDPTNDIIGLSRYMTALKILFDPTSSTLDLVSIDIKNDPSTGEGYIEAEWILGGSLKLPWRPKIENFTGKSKYYLDPDTRLIIVQRQEWSVSGAKALLETFTPGGMIK